MNKKIIIPALITVIVFVVGCSNQQGGQKPVSAESSNQIGSNTAQQKNDFGEDYVKAANGISEEEALETVNRLIGQKKISLTLPQADCRVENFGCNTRDDVNYYVIRVAYVDPDNKENTETLARYWVSRITGDVLQEDLWTGNLSLLL